MERGDDDSLWCNAPKDILGLISSRLVAGEYVVFRAVCRNWRDLVPLPRIPREYNTPRLMTLYEERGDVEFFHPLHDALITQKMDIPELVKGSRIRCALKDWLLMSKGNRGMFFFNAVSKHEMQVPREGRQYEICTEYVKLWIITYDIGAQ
ncbi:hypothetical protein CQW23_26099 [Capsicum baccatum]|uniref:F-box domain-containing protein n=1 Tax=Capsicum baccatum TaxID=33114 RepID=A0A2G2VMW8_CAPBA|nr:hypothetical protein CQW23_26099 [Capsicum baccatum]